jgi:hypothetical protein
MQHGGRPGRARHRQRPLSAAPGGRAHHLRRLRAAGPAQHSASRRRARGRARGARRAGPRRGRAGGAHRRGAVVGYGALGYHVPGPLFQVVKAGPGGGAVPAGARIRVRAGDLGRPCRLQQAWLSAAPFGGRRAQALDIKMALPSAPWRTAARARQARRRPCARAPRASAATAAAGCGPWAPGFDGCTRARPASRATKQEDACRSFIKFAKQGCLKFRLFRVT